MDTRKAFKFEFVYDTNDYANEFNEEIESATYDEAKEKIVDALKEALRDNFGCGEITFSNRLMLLEGKEIYKS